MSNWKRKRIIKIHQDFAGKRDGLKKRKNALSFNVKNRFEKRKLIDNMFLFIVT